ncbi:MAG: peroxiredoxin-like family protein [Verrucomicrobiales bacterium]|nr:peroxiredoxin-like family protein [Verrucomicrobiales bacterium]
MLSTNHSSLLSFPLLLAVAFTTALPAVAGDLQDKLDARRDAFLEKASPDLIQSQEKALADLQQSGLTDQALNVGDKAPDFTLGDPDGKPVRLSDLLEDGPVVLTWYRGGWCPYCNITLASLTRHNDDFRKLGATLVALTPELPDTNSSTVKEQGLPFEVLSDINHKVADQYGLVFKLNNDTAERYRKKFGLVERSGAKAADRLPLAATYVIRPNGVISYAFVDADYRRRAEPEEIITALKKLQAE